MKNLILGFKMYSDELKKFEKEAVEFYNKKNCQYIELFVNPGNMQYLQEWQDFKKNYDIPITLHAPHSVFNMNFADKDRFEYNKMIFAQVNVWAEVLDVQYVVVHPGKGFNIEETVRQLNLINPKRMVIENKPFLSKKDMQRTYRGATIEEITFIRKNHPCRFCLDIAHCICTANELGENPYEYLKKFQKIHTPDCYHISGNLENSKVDLHTHFDKCDWDLEKIFSIIDTTKNITVETRHPEDSEVFTFLNDETILRNQASHIIQR